MCRAEALLLQSFHKRQERSEATRQLESVLNPNANPRTDYFWKSEEAHRWAIYGLG